jgi:hypothetical protein
VIIVAIDPRGPGDSDSVRLIGGRRPKGPLTQCCGGDSDDNDSDDQY